MGDEWHISLGNSKVDIRVAALTAQPGETRKAEIVDVRFDVVERDNDTIIVSFRIQSTVPRPVNPNESVAGAARLLKERLQEIVAGLNSIEGELTAGAFAGADRGRRRHRLRQRGSL